MANESSLTITQIENNLVDAYAAFADGASASTAKTVNKWAGLWLIRRPLSAAKGAANLTLNATQVEAMRAEAQAYARTAANTNAGVRHLGFNELR